MRTAEQIAQDHQAKLRPGHKLTFSPSELALLAAIDEALKECRCMKAKQFARHHRGVDE